MDQKLISIYVGNEVTRVCEVVKKSATSILVNNATEVATPAGSFEDGYILDVSAIAEAIRGCVFGKGFNATKAVFTISSKKIANKEVVIPYIRGDKKIAALLNANSLEYFPMSATGRFVFAHNVMENFQDEEGKKMRLNAVCAPEDLVEGYYELAHELRLQVENIDYVGNSVLQLLSLQMKENDTELVLQIEKDVTFVNVMAGKEVILQRTVPYGKNAVVNSIMEIKKLTEKDAKTLLANRDMIMRQVTDEEYSEAVRYLISSIGRIVEYHRSRNPERIIEGIKVFGEGSAIAGIDEVLQQELGAEVTRFDTLQGIKVSGKAYLTSDSALRYLANFGAVLNPIGLVIDGGKNREEASKNADKILYILLAVIAVIMIGVVAYFLMGYYQQLAIREQLKIDIDNMADAEVIARQYKEAGDAYRVIAGFNDSTHTDNVMLTKFITDLEQITPSGLVINDLSVSSGAVSFKGTAACEEQVAEYIMKVKALDYVDDVWINETKATLIEVDPNAPANETATTPEESANPDTENAFTTDMLMESNEKVEFTFSCRIVDRDFVPTVVQEIPEFSQPSTEEETEEVAE